MVIGFEEKVHEYEKNSSILKEKVSAIKKGKRTKNRKRKKRKRKPKREQLHFFSALHFKNKKGKLRKLAQQAR